MRLGTASPPTRPGSASHVTAPTCSTGRGGTSVTTLIWRQINNPLIWVPVGSAVVAMAVDPTEGALVTAGEKLGVHAAHTRGRYARLNTIPFESANQFMATLHDWGAEGRKIVVKGAPEAVLGRSGNVDPERVIRQVAAFACEGMRVLSFAEKRFDRGELAAEDGNQGFTFTGLELMIDPPRAEAIDAIRACHRAGITVKMITGDHRGTALAIGEQLGLAKRGARAVTGVELAAMDAATMREIVKDHHVFARVAPEQKLGLVRALQDNGQVTAMTGPGATDLIGLRMPSPTRTTATESRPAGIAAYSRSSPDCRRRTWH